MVSDLKKRYQIIKPAINERLNEFKALMRSGDDKAILREMCFCMCTPQNKAERAWAAVLALDESGHIPARNTAAVAKILRREGVRFHNNKAKHITTNTKNFYPDTKNKIHKLLSQNTIVDARNLLAKTVVGWGLKEASHFLRNIGFGAELCILDRHIMRQLAAHGVIAEVPESITTKRYLETEQTMLAFAKHIKIPADALDLLFWHEETGGLFK